MAAARPGMHLAVNRGGGQEEPPGERAARAGAGAGTARAASAWGAAVSPRMPARQTPAGGKRGPVWHLALPVRTRAGHAQGPGWFINRSQNISLNGQTVQARTPRA